MFKFQFLLFHPFLSLGFCNYEVKIKAFKIFMRFRDNLSQLLSTYTYFTGSCAIYYYYSFVVTIVLHSQQIMEFGR